MKRLNRKEEAVSPVIATILMVAITVVLAATLYMMVGDIGEDGTALLAGSLDEHSSEDDNVVLTVGLTTPSSADLDDVAVAVFDADGTLAFESDDVEYQENSMNGDNEIYFTYRGAGADDDEIIGGARLCIDFDPGELDEDGYEGYEVELSISGYSGQLSEEL